MASSNSSSPSGSNNRPSRANRQHQNAAPTNSAFTPIQPIVNEVNMTNNTNNIMPIEAIKTVPIVQLNQNKSSHLPCGLLVDFFQGVNQEENWNNYTQYFRQLFQLERVIDYLDLHRKTSCKLQSPTQGVCKANSPCIPLAPKTLGMLGQRFAEMLFQHPKNNKPTEKRHLMCSSCWCPLALYDVNKSPSDQHPQTFTVWWENPNVCPVPSNIGKILCRCCFELRKSCASDLDFGKCVASYFKRNGTAPVNKATGKAVHTLYHFQSVDDVKTLRLKKEMVGTKRRFCLMWLQQRGLVCYPIPLEFNGTPDKNWHSELEQDHITLYGKAMVKSDNDNKMDDDEHLAANRAATNNSNSNKRSLEEDADIIKDEPEKNPFLAYELCNIANNTVGDVSSPSNSVNGTNNNNNSTSTNNQGLGFHSLENLQQAIKSNNLMNKNNNAFAAANSDQEKMQKRLLEEEKRLMGVMNKLHKIENKVESYISFWLPLDPRPDIKSLNSWTVTRRTLNAPLSKENYLIVNQFCHHLEKMFGLAKFLQWALIVFPWAKSNVGFEQYQLQRFAQYNYEEFFRDELKNDEHYKQQVNQEVQVVANDAIMQEALQQFKQMTEARDNHYKQWQESQKAAMAIKKQVDEMDRFITNFKHTKLLQVINVIEQNVQHVTEVLKSNNIEVVNKMKRTCAVNKFTDLNTSAQQTYIAELLVECGVITAADPKLLSCVELVVSKLNDKTALQAKFTSGALQIVDVKLIGEESVSKKARKSAVERRGELLVRNKWQSWNRRPSLTAVTNANNNDNNEAMNNNNNTMPE